MSIIQEALLPLKERKCFYRLKELCDENEKLEKENQKLKEENEKLKKQIYYNVGDLTYEEIIERDLND